MWAALALLALGLTILAGPTPAADDRWAATTLLAVYACAVRSAVRGAVMRQGWGDGRSVLTAAIAAKRGAWFGDVDWLDAGVGGLAASAGGALPLRGALPRSIDIATKASSPTRSATSFSSVSSPQR